MIQTEIKKKNNMSKLVRWLSRATRRVMTIMLAAFLAVAFLSCGGDDNSAQKTEPPGPPLKRTQRQPQPSQRDMATTSSAEDLSALTAFDINGQQHQFSEWIGKRPVIVNFWGTWCPPCRREIPDLIRLYEEYKSSGVEIVSIAVRDTPDKVDRFVTQNGMDWVMLMFDPQLAKPFGLSGSVPTTIFFDKNGKEVTRFIGARPYEIFKPVFEQIAG